MATDARRWALVVAPLLIGCQASAPRFTTADEQAVRELTDISVASLKSANFGPWLDLWEDDGIMQPPNAPTVVGRAGREAWTKAFPPLDSFRVGDVRVTGEGNLAYGTTTYMLKATGLPADSGKQLFVARRQADGKWKVVAVSYSSDLPVPGTANGMAPTLAGEPRGAASARTFTTADSASIVALEARLERSARAHRWSEWNAEFAADPVRMPPNAKTVSGRSAVEAFNIAGPNVTRFDVRVSSVVGTGTMAIASGDYRAVVPAGRDASGKPTPAIDEDGKFMQQLARQPDGSWKIVRDIWNSNRP